MCLIVLGWRLQDEPPLIVAANRDEFHNRPTAGMDFWQDAPHVLAGRDLQAGGSWMGVVRDGRFAALTNFREPSAQRSDARSRGGLVAGFLVGDMNARDYARNTCHEAAACNGFNLLLCDGETLVWVGYRRGGEAQWHALEPGIHALSNHLPGTPWPKLLRARDGFARALAQRDAAARKRVLFDVLRDDTPAADADLPDTGVGIERERRLSPVFIADDEYGTRSSTVLTVGNACIDAEEHRFGPGGKSDGASQFTFRRERTIAHGRLSSLKPECRQHADTEPDIVPPTTCPAAGSRSQ